MGCRVPHSSAWYRPRGYSCDKKRGSLTAKGKRRWQFSIRSWNRPIAALLFVQLLAGAVLMPQRVFFPIYLEETLEIETVLISTFVALGQFAGMIAALVGGALSDGMGRKWTLVLGLLGFVFGSLLYLVSSPLLVLMFWVISGLGLGFHAVGGEGYLIDSAGREHLGVLSAFYNWGFTLGGALGSATAGIVLESGDFRALGLTLLAVSLAAALGAVAFLPQLRGPTREKSVSLRDTLIGYRDVLRQRAVLVLASLRFLPTCYWGMVSVLIPLLINRATGAKTAVALYATLSQILASLAQVAAGQSADRWGPRWPALVAFSGVVVSALGLAASASREILWLFYAFGILGACAAWSLSTLMPTLISIAAPIEERGRVVGALNFLWNMGMMVGAMIGGALVSIAVGLPFLVAALLNLLAIGLAVPFLGLVARQKTSTT
jgi:MFS family permease